LEIKQYTENLML